jgi:hypothetical protein
MQFINKTGLVLIGAAFLSAPVFVGCDDDGDGTDLTGGSGGTAGTAGTAGSAGSAGSAGEGGTGGDDSDSGAGGSAGEGGTSGTGGSSSDPDAGDAGGDPRLPSCQAICDTQAQLSSGADAGATDGGAGDCGPADPSTCAQTTCTIYDAFPDCAEFTGPFFECFATQPVSVYQCVDGVPNTPYANPELGGTGTEHGCVAQERALFCCLGAIDPSACD